MKNLKVAITELCEVLDRNNLTIERFKDEDFVFTQKTKVLNGYATKKIWVSVPEINKDTILEVKKGD